MQEEFYMTDLECNVNSCVYNCSNLCSRYEIKVGGKDAQKKSKTCCSSYEMRTSGEYSNSMVNQIAAPITDVDCEAYVCIYNASGKCDADDICIDCCDNCEPENMSETECASFRANTTNRWI